MELPGDLWLSVPATRLVGVPSPDLLELTLGDEDADFGEEADLAGEEDDLIGEETDLAGEETDLAGEVPDLGVEDTDVAGDERDLGGEDADLAGDDAALGGEEADLGGDVTDLGDEQADLEGEVVDFSGEEIDFTFEVADSVLTVLSFLGVPDHEDSSHGSKGSSACPLESEPADLRLYLTPSLSCTGDTNMSLIGLVYCSWELGGVSTQVADLMVTSILDVFLEVLAMVFESCSLFNDDRSLP